MCQPCAERQQVSPQKAQVLWPAQAQPVERPKCLDERQPREARSARPQVGELVLSEQEQPRDARQ